MRTFPGRWCATLALVTVLVGQQGTWAMGATDSGTLVRLAGGTTELFNSFIDLLWRRPFSQRGIGPDTTSVYRAQRTFPSTTPFMCNTSDSRSPTPPTSVHRLRPGDIDVVAAMGDSLTSGNGPMAHDLARLLLNHRGLSWAIGGQSDWRKYLTLPNIIKEFNPKVLGFSTGDGYSYSRSAGFNVAVSGAITPDLPYQARVLVRRMRNDPRVDMKNHWKLVSILIGSNDICIYACYEPGKYSGKAHAAKVREALDILHDNIPRLFVNFVLQPELSALRSMPDEGLICKLSHQIECPCMFGAYATTKAALADRFVSDYRKFERELVEGGRYDLRDDFTVELQPFTVNAMNNDMRSHQSMDMELFAIDCFHLSQKGNAYAANALWNNMLEAEGTKSDTWEEEFKRFLCPSKKAPFLFTRKNSKLFLETGRQYDQTDELINENQL